MFVTAQALYVDLCQSSKGSVGNIAQDNGATPASKPTDDHRWDIKSSQVTRASNPPYVFSYDVPAELIKDRCASERSETFRCSNETISGYPVPIDVREQRQIQGERALKAKAFIEHADVSTHSVIRARPRCARVMCFANEAPSTNTTHCLWVSFADGKAPCI